jgi:hypothetical protein
MRLRLKQVKLLFKSAAIGHETWSIARVVGVLIAQGAYACSWLDGLLALSRHCGHVVG